MNAPITSRAITLRASALPFLWLCPAAAQAPELVLEEDKAAADVGSATHELLRGLAETGEIDWAAVPAVAARWNADADEIRMLCAQGAKLWAQVSGSFPVATTEVSYLHDAGDLVLTGHADIVSDAAGVLQGGDWKTGRKDSDYRRQMEAYCTLALLDDPDLASATFTALWVRDCEAQSYSMTRAEVPGWLDELRARILRQPETYHPGSHCLYCPRSHECPGRAALVRREVQAFTDAPVDFGLMAANDVIGLLEQADTVAKLAARVRDVIRQHVAVHGELVGDGRRLALVQEERRELDPLAAWPVLEGRGFGDEDFAACVKLSVCAVEDRVAKAAGRGKGAAAVRALREELQAAGAVWLKTIEKLTVKRG
jgi:hypothetical protein